jgi:gliding motility-associated-like protein
MADSTFFLDVSYELDIPNFFTPNNDGQNDRWEIDGIERLPETKISIYDRYGKLLRKYAASEPGWNGEYLNRQVPSDDYWYVIELKPVNKIIKGNITIIR